jgi:solute carrier family 10 (sodium/bile acid cotransporter), member 7
MRATLLCTSHRDLILQQPAISILYCFLVIQFFVCLMFNAAVCIYLLRLQPPEAVAVMIMSSQKSGAVAVTVISYITHDTSQQGLLAIPCLIGQVTQVMVGSLVARQLAVWVLKRTAASVPPDDQKSTAEEVVEQGPEEGPTLEF